jgi:hypothetical protein
MIKGSYILVARNDNYCGDSVGRLTNTLNFLGEALDETLNLNQSECVLVDWASPNKPLKDVLKLNDLIKSILKIVTVPTKIAEKYQKDSPFSEVHAMNCGFRHMSGKYFMRIDQDTLVGYKFIEWFYNEFEVLTHGFRWPKVAFSGRRNMRPQDASFFKKIIKDENYSKKVKILHPNNYYNTIYPNGNSNQFYGSAVGIMIVEKKLYEEFRGFNEELIYMNQMDTEFLNRLSNKNTIYNLSQKTENDFYHQHHSRLEAAANDIQSYAEELGSRTTNDLSYREYIFKNPNSENWGLRDENLEVCKI